MSRLPVLMADGTPWRPTGGYKAAQFSRETQNLPSVCMRPTDEVTSGDLSVLRARCRYIIANYPQASGALNAFARRCASGMRLQSRMQSAAGEYLAEANDSLERVLKEAGRGSALDSWRGFTTEGDSFRAAMRMAFATRYTDGEVLAVRAVNRDRRRTLAREWQILDGDALAENYGGTYPGKVDGNRVVMGVELSPLGRPVAYHFWDYPAGYQPGYGSSREVKRVLAENVVHWFRKDRPGQVRGIPELARLIMGLADVEEFLKAKIQAEWIANAFAALLTSDDPENSPMLTTDEELQKTRFGDYQMDIASGMVQALPAGTKVDFANPNRPGGDLQGFTSVYLRAAACACGLSYEQFAGDFSKTNYSSMRSALQESRLTFLDWEDEFNEGFIEPIYRDAVDQVYKVHGLLEKPDAIDVYAHWVQRRQPGWVDPLKEVQADDMAISRNMTTLQERCAARGLDWREVLKQRKAEQDLTRELGLDSASIEAWGSVILPDDEDKDQSPAEDQRNEEVARVVSAY